MDRPRRDPTANAAIGNVMREQKRKRRRDATMKPTLNPCTNCGGVAVIRYEAGIAVAACTKCGRMAGPFDIAEVGAVGANIDGGGWCGT